MKLLKLALIVINIFITPQVFGAENLDKYVQARYEMVEQQLRARGISDENVLRAMLKVPRHLFIPEKNRFRYDPYGDYPVPIGEDQTISQPYMVALMTSLLKLKSSDRVLEIGTGSGYQAAILAELVKEVYTIEILPNLARQAQQILNQLGYSKVKVKCGDGYKGWKEYAPYNAIIVTCAPDHIPQPLINQLAEGGRMVIPVGNYPRQTLKLIEKKQKKLMATDVTGVLFVPMTGEEIQKERQKPK